MKKDKSQAKGGQVESVVVPPVEETNKPANAERGDTATASLRIVQIRYQGKLEPGDIRAMLENVFAEYE